MRVQRLPGSQEPTRGSTPRLMGAGRVGLGGGRRAWWGPLGWGRGLDGGPGGGPGCGHVRGEVAGRAGPGGGGEVLAGWLGRRMGWYGPVGVNVHTTRKGA